MNRTLHSTENTQGRVNNKLPNYAQAARSSQPRISSTQQPPQQEGDGLNDSTQQIRNTGPSTYNMTQQGYSHHKNSYPFLK